MKLVHFFKSTLLLSILSVSSTVSADSIKGIHPLLSDKFSMSLGGFAGEHSGDYKYNGPGPLEKGVTIDLEDDLGISNNKLLPRTTLKWRFNDAHQLQFEYFRFQDSAVSNFTGRFGAGIFNGSIKSEEELELYRLFYGYNFLKEENYEIGAGIGIHVSRLQASLEGSATVAGIPLPTYKDEINEWGFLPNVGAYGSYAFNDKWLVSGRIDWLSLAIDNMDGTLWNNNLAVQYQAFDNFGVGVGYSYVRVNMSEDKNEPGGWESELQFAGPTAFLTINF